MREKYLKITKDVFKAKGKEERHKIAYEPTIEEKNDYGKINRNTDTVNKWRVKIKNLDTVNKIINKNIVENIISNQLVALISIRSIHSFLTLYHQVNHKGIAH